MLLWPERRICGDNNETLKVNECCFEVFSNLKSSFDLFVRSIKCTQCNFTVQKPITNSIGKSSFILDANYPSELFISNEQRTYCNKTFHCGGGGKYSMNITRDSCSDVITELVPESIWANVGIILSVIITFLFLYTISKCLLTAICRRRDRWQMSFRQLDTDLGTVISRDDATAEGRPKRRSRISAVDVFRGIAISLMIFVNYGGGGYSIFKHSPWNGLTIADVVFPWFIWIMGVSVALSLRSKLRASESRMKILTHILNRSVILIMLGLILNSKSNCDKNGSDSFSSLRVPGVLQRIGVTYFIVGVMELVFMKPQRNEHFGPWNVCAEFVDSTVQWIIALAFVGLHEAVTFLLPVPGCPKGYLGPGGWHLNSKFENCTGGAAGYIDRLLLSGGHMYQHPTCKRIYHTTMPYDPEGLLGIATSVFCAFLGVHAGRIILYYECTSSRIWRWLLWSVILGLIGGLLCGFTEDGGIIPINKNLWSLSYVCVTSSLSFAIFCFLHWLIDYRRLYDGFPFCQAGMNALLLYIGHDLLKKYLPWYWKPFTDTHLELLIMNLSATIIWLCVSVILYKKNLFLVL